MYNIYPDKSSNATTSITRVTTCLRNIAAAVCVKINKRSSKYPKTNVFGLLLR